MTQFALAEAQMFLRAKARTSRRTLRRRIIGSALMLLTAGGYAVWHGDTVKPGMGLSHGPAAMDGARPVRR